jgi:hypothetical protein
MFKQEILISTNGCLVIQCLKTLRTLIDAAVFTIVHSAFDLVVSIDAA